jgi:hypothetical protein
MLQQTSVVTTGLMSTSMGILQFSHHLLLVINPKINKTYEKTDKNLSVFFYL